MRNNIRAAKAKFTDRKVVFEAELQAVVQVVIRSKARARTRLRHIRKSIRHHPFLIETARTEQLTLARSPGSRRDLGRRLLRVPCRRERKQRKRAVKSSNQLHGQPQRRAWPVKSVVLRWLG